MSEEKSNNPGEEKCTNHGEEKCTNHGEEKCTNHNERESAGTCVICEKKYCKECLVNVGGKDYCSNCIGERVCKESPMPVRPEKKSKFWAFLLSLVPGLGYLYLGLMNRGLQTMIIFFGSIFVTSFIGFEELMALVLPVVLFYSIFDTQQLINKFREGVLIEDKPFIDIKNIPFNQKWLGYALIVIGFLAMMQNLPFIIPFWFKRMLPPVIIIGLGVAILYRNTRD